MTQHTQKILHAWLFVIAIAHILAGLALPLLSLLGGMEAYTNQLNTQFWQGQNVPAEAAEFQRWIIALFGPTVASWGVLMAYLVYAGARTGQRWPWDALLLAILVWAPADIAISLLQNFWPHVVLDMAAVIAIALPVWILRRHTPRLLTENS